MAKKFPKTLYVKIEEDGDTSYFVADADASPLAEQGEKIRIATYELVDTHSVILVTQIAE